MGKREALEEMHSTLEGIISAANGDPLALQKQIHAVRDRLTQYVPKLLITTAWNPYALLLDVPFTKKEEFAYFKNEISQAEIALRKLEKNGRIKAFVIAIHKLRALALEQMTYECAMQPSRERFLRTSNAEMLVKNSSQYRPANTVLQGIIIAAARRVIENASELPSYYKLELRQWENAQKQREKLYSIRPSLMQ